MTPVATTTTAAPMTPAAPGVVERWQRVLRRRWRAGLALFGLVGALAAAVVLLARPIWRVESTMRLGAPAPVGGMSLGGTNSPAGLFTLFQQMTGDPFANELELLSSRTVVEGVVLDNALNVALDAPRGWYRDSVLASLAAGPDTRKAVFQATWLPAGSIRVRRISPTEAALGDVAPGRPLGFGGMVVAFRPWRTDMPRSVKLKTIPFGDAVRRTASRLESTRERREANLVRLAYDDPDPGLALGVVRSASARYTALRALLQRRESGETADSLKRVADQTQAQLRQVEDEMERFQRESRLVAPAAQSEAFVKRQAEVLTSLQKATAELGLVDEVLRRLDAEKDPAAAWAGLVAHPTFLENKTLGDMLGNLIHLQQQRLDLGGRRTAEDKGIQSLDRQIAFLDGSLRSLVRQYRDGVGRDVALLKGQAATLDSLLAAAPANAIELGRRERSVRELSEVYFFTDQRLRQESLRNAVSFANVQVVDPPEVLFKPVWPRKTLGLGVGLLLALATGALGMALSERADRTVRGAAEVRALVGAPVLAALAPAPDGALVLPAAERLALLLRARAAPERGLVLTPVGNGAAARGAAAVARALAEDRLAPQVPAGHAELPARGVPATTSVALGPAVERYASAVELGMAAEAGAAVVLVLCQGVTRRDDAVRAAALLREAGTPVAGAVLIAADARGVREAWL